MTRERSAEPTTALAWGGGAAQRVPNHIKVERGKEAPHAVITVHGSSSASSWRFDITRRRIQRMVAASPPRSPNGVTPAVAASIDTDRTMLPNPNRFCFRHKVIVIPPYHLYASYEQGRPYEIQRCFTSRTMDHTSVTCASFYQFNCSLI
jgi:hypothetical protein